MTNKVFTGDIEKFIEALTKEPAPVNPVEEFSRRSFTNMRDGPRRHPSYAHFPGTGPAGETCKSCDHLRAVTRTKGGAVGLVNCAQFHRMMPETKQTPIDWNAAACKYFALRAGRVTDA